MKPQFSLTQATDLLKSLYDLTISEINSLPSYDDQNFYVLSSDGKEHVLKIMNSGDSQNPSLIEVQTYAMSYLHQNGIPAQTATPTATGQLMSLEEMGKRFVNAHLCTRTFYIFSLAIKCVQACCISSPPFEHVINS